MTGALPYILFCFWAFSIGYLESRNLLGKFGQQNCLLISVIILAVLAAMRQVDFYSDTANYITHFNETGEFFSQDDNSFLDGGFVFLAKVTKIFSTDPSVFLWIYALFEAALLWFAATRFTKNPNIFIFFFFLLFYLPLFQIIIRQGAASLLLIPFVFSFIEKRYFKAIIWSFLAFIFHKTAIVFVLAAIFINLFSKGKYGILLAAILTCIGFMFISVNDILYYFTLLAGDNYLDYAQGQLTTNYWGYTALSLIIFSFLFFIRKTELNDFIFILVVIGTILQLVLMPFGPFVERLTEYWLIFFPILFANTFSSNSISLTNKNYLFFSYSFMFIAIFLYFLLQPN